MQRHPTLKKLCAAAAIITVSAFSSMAMAGGADNTTLTYQGILTNAGGNVDGPTDLEFRLFDAEVAGNQVGSTVMSTETVTDGAFTALVDFGVDPYTSPQPLWLEITVETEVLSRQQLTSVPFSLATRGINVDATGQVGIGVDTPLTPLAILGSAGANPVGITQGQVGGGSTMELTTADDVDAQATRLLLRGGTAVSDIEFYRGNSGAEVESMRIEGSTGNVGIGTTNPLAQLAVVSVPESNCCVAHGTPGCDDMTCQDAICAADSFCCDNQWDQLCTDAALASCEICDNDEPVLTAMGGNVGIGTTSPSTALDVAGTVTATAFVGDGSGLTNIAGAGAWTENGSDIHYSDGNIGIGTDSPLVRVHARRLSGNTDDPTGVFEVHNCGNSCGQPKYTEAVRLINENVNGRTGIGFVTDETPDLATNPGVWIGTGDRSANNHTDLIMTTKDGEGTLQDRIRVKGDTGFVGVGRSNPTTMLDVQGAVTIRGGADIVEGFETSCGTAFEPGTVVIIDPANPGKLMCAHGAYDRKVAGVVSGAGGVAAGIKLGQDGVMDGDLPVAMTGRVYVKASAENGAIEPGDLLTTADLAGHAMKATNGDLSHGAVIGKAMSALDSGAGLVLVLVNLQ